MKWFRHQSDSYSNLKLQRVIAEHSLKGYGLFWICVELVAQQGEKQQIKADKGWRKIISYISREKEDEIEKFLGFFAEVNLIDKNALDKGNLFIPKLREYSDDYTNKVRRKSGQSPDKVRTKSGQSPPRLDKIR